MLPVILEDLSSDARENRRILPIEKKEERRRGRKNHRATDGGGANERGRAAEGSRADRPQFHHQNPYLTFFFLRQEQELVIL